MSEPASSTLAAWRERQRLEFGPDRTADADALLDGMTTDARLNYVSTISGGRGRRDLRVFYSSHFLPGLPSDARLETVFPAAGSEDRVVDEFILTFTHDIRMDWLLPGVAPTGRPVRLPMVTIAQFEAGNLADQRTYWDQATILVQIGKLEPGELPVSGSEQAEKVIHPGHVLSNELPEAGDGIFPTSSSMTHVRFHPLAMPRLWKHSGLST